MKNTGFEFSLNYRKSFGDLFIDIAPNFYTLKNEVLAIGQEVQHWMILVPEPWSVGRWVVISGGSMMVFSRPLKKLPIMPFKMPRTAPGDIRFRDLNNDNVINDNDRTFIGDAIPDFYYGLNINAEYKNFDFTFFASGSSGGVAVNNMYRGLMSSQSSGNTNYHEDILGRWTPINHEYRSTTDDLPGSEFEW